MKAEIATQNQDLSKPYMKIASVLPKDISKIPLPNMKGEKKSIEVRVRYTGKAEGVREYRHVTMEVALRPQLLRTMFFVVEDVNFSNLLAEYCKQKKIPIEKIDISHVKNI